MLKLLLTCLLLVPSMASADTDSIDDIINAYYDVVSGSVGHEIRETKDSKSFSSGFNSISLYFKDDRWWISSWSTQYKK